MHESRKTIGFMHESQNKWTVRFEKTEPAIPKNRNKFISKKNGMDVGYTRIGAYLSLSEFVFKFLHIRIQIWI